MHVCLLGMGDMLGTGYIHQFNHTLGAIKGKESEGMYKRPNLKYLKTKKLLTIEKSLALRQYLK